MIKSNIDKSTCFEKRFENVVTVVFQNSTKASKVVGSIAIAILPEV